MQRRVLGHSREPRLHCRQTLCVSLLPQPPVSHSSIPLCLTPHSSTPPVSHSFVSLRMSPPSLRSCWLSWPHSDSPSWVKQGRTASSESHKGAVQWQFSGSTAEYSIAAVQRQAAFHAAFQGSLPPLASQPLNHPPQPTPTTTSPPPTHTLSHTSTHIPPVSVTHPGVSTGAPGTPTSCSTAGKSCTQHRHAPATSQTTSQPGSSHRPAWHHFPPFSPP